MKKSLSYPNIFDGLIQSFYKTIFWLIIFGILYGFVLLIIFDIAIDYWYIFIIASLGVGMGSVLSTFVEKNTLNNLIDRQIIKQYNKLSNNSNKNIRNHFANALFEKLSRNSFFLRIDKLDEMIDLLYSDSDGEIFLFNPSPDLLNSNDPKWKKIRKSIKDNNQRLKLKISTPDRDSFDSPRGVGSKLDMPENSVEITHLSTTSSKSLSEHFRMALYYRKDKIGDYKIAYFIYRPRKEPYFDNFVLIQKKEVLEELNLFGSDNIKLYEKVRELKNLS